MKNLTLPLLVIAALISGCSQQSSGGEQSAGGKASAAQSGRALFSPCAVCHSVTQGEASRVGPNLYGVFGRPAGTAGDFVYSDAMRDADIVWTEETLDAFLENPPAYIRGNRMAFAGEKDAEKRAALVAYLKSLN